MPNPPLKRSARFRVTPPRQPIAAPPGLTRIGTTRRDAAGNQIPGEVNQYGQPLGSSDPNSEANREAHWNDSFNGPTKSSVPPTAPVWSPGSSTSRPVAPVQSAQPVTAASLQNAGTAQGIVAAAPEQQGLATPPRPTFAPASNVTTRSAPVRSNPPPQPSPAMIPRGSVGQVTQPAAQPDYNGVTTNGGTGSTTYDPSMDHTAPRIGNGQIAPDRKYNPAGMPAGATNVGSVRFAPASTPSQISDETGVVKPLAPPKPNMLNPVAQGAATPVTPQVTPPVATPAKPVAPVAPASPAPVVAAQPVTFGSVTANQPTNTPPTVQRDTTAAVPMTSGAQGSGKPTPDTALTAGNVSMTQPSNFSTGNVAYRQPDTQPTAQPTGNVTFNRPDSPATSAAQPVATKPVDDDELKRKQQQASQPRFNVPNYTPELNG